MKPTTYAVAFREDNMSVQKIHILHSLIGKRPAWLRSPNNTLSLLLKIISPVSFLFLPWQIGSTEKHARQWETQQAQTDGKRRWECCISYWPNAALEMKKPLPTHLQACPPDQNGDQSWVSLLCPMLLPICLPTPCINLTVQVGVPGPQGHRSSCTTLAMVARPHWMSCHLLQQS